MNLNMKEFTVEPDMHVIPLHQQSEVDHGIQAPDGSKEFDSVNIAKSRPGTESRDTKVPNRDGTTPNACLHSNATELDKTFGPKSQSEGSGTALLDQANVSVGAATPDILSQRESTFSDVARTTEHDSLLKHDTGLNSCTEPSTVSRTVHCKGSQKTRVRFCVTDEGLAKHRTRSLLEEGNEGQPEGAQNAEGRVSRQGRQSRPVRKRSQTPFSRLRSSHLDDNEENLPVLSNAADGKDSEGVADPSAEARRVRFSVTKSDDTAEGAEPSSSSQDDFGSTRRKKSRGKKKGMVRDKTPFGRFEQRSSLVEEKDGDGKEEVSEVTGVQTMGVGRRVGFSMPKKSEEEMGNQESPDLVPARGRLLARRSPRKRSQTPFNRKPIEIDSDDGGNGGDESKASNGNGTEHGAVLSATIVQHSEAIELKRVRFCDAAVTDVSDKHTEAGASCKKETANEQPESASAWSGKDSELGCEQIPLSRRMMSYFTSDDEDSRSERRSNGRSPTNAGNGPTNAGCGPTNAVEELTHSRGTQQSTTSLEADGSSCSRGRSQEVSRKISNRDKTPFSRRAFDIYATDDEARKDHVDEEGDGQSGFGVWKTQRKVSVNHAKPNSHRVTFVKNVDGPASSKPGEGSGRGRERVMQRKPGKRDQTPFNRRKFELNSSGDDDEAEDGQRTQPQAHEERRSASHDPGISGISEPSHDARGRSCLVAGRVFVPTSRRGRSQRMRKAQKRSLTPFSAAARSASEWAQEDDENLSCSADLEANASIRSALPVASPASAVASEGRLRSSNGKGVRTRRLFERGTQVSLGSQNVEDPVTCSCRTFVSRDVAIQATSLDDTGSQQHAGSQQHTGSQQQKSWVPLAVIVVAHAVVIGVANYSA